MTLGPWSNPPDDPASWVRYDLTTGEPVLVVELLTQEVSELLDEETPSPTYMWTILGIEESNHTTGRANNLGFIIDELIPRKSRFDRKPPL